MEASVYLQKYVPKSAGDTGYFAGLAKCISEWHEDSTQLNVSRASNWELALRYLAGDQWLRPNITRVYGYEKIPYSGNQRNIERCTTNHILRWVVTNASVFTAAPHITTDPNSEEPHDKQAAKAGKIILDHLWESKQKTQMYYRIALWMLTLGNCFRESCRKESLSWLPQEDGSASYTHELSPQIVPPFRLTFDYEARTFAEVRELMDCQPARIDWIQDVYGRKGDGFTGLADSVKPKDVDNAVMRIFESTKHIVEGGSYQEASFDSMSFVFKNSNMLRKVYSAPCKVYPKGRLVILAEDVVLYDSMLTKDQKSPAYFLGGEVWHPYTCAGYLENPSSLWAFSLVAPLVPLQKAINVIDTMVAYNRKTMAMGQWLIPNGSEVGDNKINGQAQDIRYNPVPAGNVAVKPERIPGVPLPAQVMEERRLKLEEGDMIAFAAGLKSGRNPSGVNTVGQMQILQEEAQQSRSKQIEMWEKFLEKSEQLDLLVFQDAYRVPDVNLAKKLSSLSKDISFEEWKTFIGADLRDNATIRIEPGSTIKESKLIRQQTILNLATAGLLPEAMGDPIGRKNFLEEFGLTKMFTDNNADVKAAEFSIEQMRQGKLPPLLSIYNPDIHLLVIARYMKDPKFLELPDDVKMLFEKRKNDLAAMLAESLQQAPLTTGEEAPEVTQVPGASGLGGRPQKQAGDGMAVV